MTQDELELQLLALWTKTRIPLTRANIQLYTREPRARADKHLDALVKASFLELDSDDEGNIVYLVRGATRPRKLSADALSAGKTFATRALAAPKGGKSVLASTALSFFFGPLGWLYAGSFREAIPGALVYVAMVSFLPSFLLMWILGMVNVVSAVAGLLYAWSYNRAGQRMPLILADKPSSKLLGR